VSAARVEDELVVPRVEDALVVIGRYGELWLKGKNRRIFEYALARNARKALADVAPCRVELATGQIVVTPGARVHDVAARMREVFGFSSISIARTAPPSPEVIARVAKEVLDEAMESLPARGTTTFRVKTQRGDKRFPMTSIELDQYVAERVMGDYVDRLQVKLTRPELTLGVHVRPERCYVYAGRTPAAGGLPVGTLGRVVSLLSGGIDSPVASWMAMKRGCDVVFASFHSYPYIGESYNAKIRRLVRHLGRFQNESVLYEVPFARIQSAIRDHCPAAYRTVLYRRMMQRIATKIAAREKARALVTGECLGQVASQTLENLTCIGAASGLPVLRPLITFDKGETIDVARAIGTFDISIEREPDCCTVFQPTRPIIRGRVDVCEDAERALDVDALVREAVEAAERRVVE